MCRVAGGRSPEIPAAGWPGSHGRLDQRADQRQGAGGVHRALPLDGGLGDFLFLNGFSIDFNRSSTFLSHFIRRRYEVCVKWWILAAGVRREDAGLPRGPNGPSAARGAAGTPPERSEAEAAALQAPEPQGATRPRALGTAAPRMAVPGSAIEPLGCCRRP